MFNVNEKSIRDLKPNQTYSAVDNILTGYTEIVLQEKQNSVFIQKKYQIFTTRVPSRGLDKVINLLPDVIFFKFKISLQLESETML